VKLSEWGQIGGYRELIGDMLAWAAARLDELGAGEAASYVTAAETPRVLMATDVGLFELDLNEQDGWRLTTHLWRDVRGLDLGFDSISYRIASRKIHMKIESPVFDEEQMHETRLEALAAFGRASLHEIAKVR
jgi:hypothetical protein